MLIMLTIASAKQLLERIMRKGVRPGDIVAIVAPEKSENVEDIMKTVEIFLSTAYENPTVAVLKVPVEDFINAVSSIRRFIVEKGGPIYVYIDTSSWVLAIETLTAAVLSGIHGEVEIDFGDRTVTFRTWDLNPETLDAIDIEILRRIMYGGAFMIDIAKELKMPKSSVWRRLLSLEKRGLVRLRRVGRRLWASITPKGLLYV